ncbi:MAG: HAD hydrolase-like protein, partial [Lentisphaerota bacterium]
PHNIIYIHTLNFLKKKKIISEETQNYKIFVLGDSIKSDIWGAAKMDFTSGLVLTGITTEERLSSHTIKPNYIFRKI